MYINPVTMGAEKWTEYVADTKARLESGEQVHNLVSNITLVLGTP